MPGRRTSPLFAVIVAAVVLFASHNWLKGIFGYGEIATDIPFLLAGAILFLAWRFNRRAANRRSSLLGSARFGDRADVQRLQENEGLLIGRSIESGMLLLLRQGERPLWAKKIRYYDQREFGRLYDPA